MSWPGAVPIPRVRGGLSSSRGMALKFPDRGDACGPRLPGRSWTVILLRSSSARQRGRWRNWYQIWTTPAFDPVKSWPSVAPVFARSPCASTKNGDVTPVCPYPFPGAHNPKVAGSNPAPATRKTEAPSALSWRGFPLFRPHRLRAATRRSLSHPRQRSPSARRGLKSSTIVQDSLRAHSWPISGPIPPDVVEPGWIWACSGMESPAIRSGRCAGRSGRRRSTGRRSPRRRREGRGAGELESPERSRSALHRIPDGGQAVRPRQRRLKGRLDLNQRPLAPQSRLDHQSQSAGLSNGSQLLGNQTRHAARLRLILLTFAPKLMHP